MTNRRDPTAKLRAKWHIFVEACISRFIWLNVEEEAGHKMPRQHYTGDINDYVS